MKITLLFYCFFWPLMSFCQSAPVANKNAFPTSTFDSIRPYREGFAAVCLKKQWGFINRDGKLVVPLKYGVVSDFVESEAVVFTDKWIIIDTVGNYINTATANKAARYMQLTDRQYLLPKTHAPRTTIVPLANSALQRPSAVGTCPPNLDFENGNFANWYCFTGKVTTVGGVNTITMFNNNPPVNTPVPNRHTMITATTSSATDPYGGFPINPPDGSGKAIRLGNDDVNDSAERVRYILQVPASAPDYSITFQYAVVLENPNNGTVHSAAEKPRMTVRVSNASTGAVVQCSDFLFVAAGAIPGFFNSAIDPNVKCKSWTPVFLNLSGYAGQTLHIEFTTADCTLGAHFGYGYVDIGPCNTSIDVVSQCGSPNTSTLTGPPGFQNYNWWNAGYTTVISTNQILTLNPAPPIGTTYHLEVIPFNGAVCKDTLHATFSFTGPTVDAGLDKFICRQGTVGIGTLGASGNTYQWLPATGLSNPNIAQPTASPPANTQYVVYMTDPGGCMDTDTVNVSITPYPPASFFATNPAQCMSGNNFTFQNNTLFPAGTFTSTWDFGDGTTSSALSPSHQYALPGIYTVKLINSGSLGCGDSITHTVQVYEKPLVVFNINNPSQCINGNSFSFQNNSSISSGSLTYQWNFGDGTGSSLATPVHSYTMAGTYMVRLIVTGQNGCIDSLDNSLQVTPLPVALFTVTPPVQCLGSNNFIFSDQSTFVGNNATYAWDFGDGTASALVTPSHSYTVASTYNVQLLVTTSTGCTAVYSRPVTVNAKPTALFSPGNAQCLKGNSFTFSNSSFVSPGTLTYQWNFGDGTGSVLMQPLHSYIATGTYPVKLIVTSNAGCKDSLTQDVVINPHPVISISATAGPTICEGSSTTLSATGAGSYQWTPVQGLSCTNCANPVASPQNNTMYIVTGFNNFNCPDTDTVNVIVKHPFDIQAAGDTICSGDTARLSVSGAFSYSLSPAAGLSSTTVNNPLVFPVQTTDYTIIGYDDANCFTDTIIVKVTVRNTPTLTLGGDLELATGETHQFNPVVTNGPIVSWLWTPVRWLSCDNCANPVATIYNDISYNLKVTNIYGCAARQTVKIKTMCKDAQVFIPNAFTPDGDGVNDIFMIRAKGISNIRYLRIFNRWGELVFERTDFPPNSKAYAWNGKIRGIQGPPDVFVYTAEVVCSNGTGYFYKGNVSILK